MAPLAAALCGNLGLVIGSFMPWAQVTTIFGQIALDGMRGDGVLTAGAGVLAAVCSGVALVEPNRGSDGDSLSRVAVIAGVVLSALGTLVAGMALFNVSDAASEASSSYVLASVGSGLYVCCLGGLVGAVGGVVAAVPKTAVVG